jgi:hypothetical protein
MKKLYLFLLMFLTFTCLKAQDYIILKDNKNVQCSISAIEKCSVIISVDKKFYKIPTFDLLGIAINVGTKKGLKKSKIFTKKLSCLYLSEKVDNYQLFSNPQVDSDVLKMNFSTGTRVDNNNLADLFKYRQKGHLVKNVLIICGSAFLGAFSILLLF